MFQRKSKQLKVFPKKSTFDQALWFVENYLPQKKNHATRKELQVDILEAETIKQFQKLLSARFKSLIPHETNTKVSFTVGSWALPYLNLLKRTGLLK